MVDERQSVLMWMFNETVNVEKVMHEVFGTKPGEGGPHQQYQAGFSNACAMIQKRLSAAMKNPASIPPGFFDAIHTQQVDRPKN